jgi:hypothetical protein
MGLPLYVIWFFSLRGFHILFLLSVLIVLFLKFIHMCIYCLGCFPPLLSTSPPHPSLPGRRCSALISNFVEDICNCFKYNMLRRGSILVLSIWCPGGFLYLNEHLYLKVWEIFCYFFVECFSYTSALHLLSFFNVHDSQDWFFDWIAALLRIPFTALQSLSKYFSVFSLISILSLFPKILSSTCSSLLAWLSTVFSIWLMELFVPRVSVWFFFFFWDFLIFC